jgi:hypothetical protein
MTTLSQTNSHTLEMSDAELSLKLDEILHSLDAANNTFTKKISSVLKEADIIKAQFTADKEGDETLKKDIHTAYEEIASVLEKK